MKKQGYLKETIERWYIDDPWIKCSLKINRGVFLSGLLTHWVHFLNDFFVLGGPRGTRQKKLQKMDSSIPLAFFSDWIAEGMQVLLRVLCFASLLLPSPSCLLERPKYCIKNFLESGFCNGHRSCWYCI
jgi:hypothetical protein